MPSLKDFRLRIASVKSTRKITSAMKMVAASKLKRAQTAAEAARPYAERMERIMGALATSLAGQEGAPALLAGTGKQDTYLLIVVSSDRGLAGGFNASIARAARLRAQELLAQGKKVKFLTAGRKARDQLRRDFAPLMGQTYEGLGRKGMTFGEADMIAVKATELFEAGEFDVCEIIYNRFASAISQVVTRQQLIPFPLPPNAEGGTDAGAGGGAVYEFEPEEADILAELLPRNLAVQIFRALLESYASNMGAQMTAMDNATRNAGEMIDKLTVRYNRTRQARITTELIEIISGAEAL
jgi:F-type H+-transporting ATPase subunit gamma